MNYIKQLNAFFDWLQCNCLPTSAQLLYHTLLMINNKCGWVEWFRRTNQSLSGLMGINERTLTSARNKLKQYGLIDFVAGTKRTDSTRYKIIKLYTDYSEDNIGEDMHSSEMGVNFTPNDAPQHTPNDAPKTAPQHTDLYKHKLKQKNKEICKEKNKTQFAEFVAMTNAEYEKLVSTYGQEKAKRMVEVLDNYKGANGKSYRSDYRAILNWVSEKVNNEFSTREKDATSQGYPNAKAYNQSKYKCLVCQDTGFKRDKDGQPIFDENGFMIRCECKGGLSNGTQDTEA